MPLYLSAGDLIRIKRLETSFDYTIKLQNDADLLKEANRLEHPFQHDTKIGRTAGGIETVREVSKIVDFKAYHVSDYQLYAEYGVPAALGSPGGGFGHNPIRKAILAPDNTIKIFLYSGTPGVSGTTSTRFSFPEDVYASSSGALWVAEGGSHDVRFYNPVTSLISIFSGIGISGNVQGAANVTRFNSANGITFIAPYYYIADTGNDQIIRADATGATTIFFRNPARYTFPTRMATFGTTLYVLFRSQGQVAGFNTTTGLEVAGSPFFGNGSYVSGFGGNTFIPPVPGPSAPLGFLQCICTDSIGNIYVADTTCSRILKYTMATGLLSHYAGNSDFFVSGVGFVDGAPTVARFNLPFGLSADSSNNIYVSDSGNNALRKIDATTGNVSTIFPSYVLNNPRSLFVDKVNNWLYIVNTNDSTIIKAIL